MRLVGLFCLMLLLSTPLQAHNVIGGAYVEGMTVEGEIAFSNGEYAQPGILVEAWDDAGNKLGETKTEEGGVFTFVATTAVRHTFKVNLGSGHLAKIVVEADEFSPGTEDTLNTASAPATTTASVGSQEKSVTSASGSVASGISPQALESLVRKAVAQQVKPLQKELRAYKEKVMLRDIAGGLGFICGLFGIAAWMAARKSRQQQD